MPPRASSRIKVGELDEILPGKGKTIVVGGHEVTVWNREGRYVASSTSAPPRLEPEVAESSCDMPGHKFDVGVGPAVTPDRTGSVSERCRVVVLEDGVYVELAIS